MATYTDVLNLTKPTNGTTNWDIPNNTNFDTIDNKLGKAYKNIWNEGDVTYITNNAKYVTDHWERWNTAKAASLVKIENDGSVTNYYCNAGTGTITWIEDIFGDSSDGAVTLSSDTDMGGIYNYTTFNDGGYTINSSDKCLIIRASESITISGEIDASEKGGEGGYPYVYQDKNIPEKGINETNGYYITNLSKKEIIDKNIDNFMNYYGGSGGYGGYGFVNNSSWVLYSTYGGKGGNGGGIVILIAPTITITGTINVSGGNGSGGVAGYDNSAHYIQSGSGGNGGLIILSYSTLNESSATYNYSGGIYGTNPSYVGVVIANGSNGIDGKIKKIEV